MKTLLTAITISLGLASVGFSQTTNDYPKDALKFAGYSSPDSALETWTWAMTKGDKTVMLQTLTPEARPQWEKMLAGKTDEQMKAEAAREQPSLPATRFRSARLFQPMRSSCILR